MANRPVFRWLPLAWVLLFAALCLFLTNPPPPVPATAPATAFSAERAWREVAVVARQPHSLGTPAHDQVRDYLVQRCRALGLQVTVQDTTVVSLFGGSAVGGHVQNVVASLPGRVPGGPAVLVLSHYDSQPHTPGASDDGSGVATALETIRALRAGPLLAHDVRWVFTDGEEAGLLGARAYAADTARLRREVGVVLNFEARGNEGPSTLFEVSSGNGWVVSELAKAGAAPLGSSLFYEIYRYLPNDTDFTAFRAAGLPGLNFAFVGGYSYYHSAVDTPGRLNLGSLQHQGDYMLPVVRHFASIPLGHAATPDLTYFNPLGTWLVHYDARWNYLLDLVAGLLLLTALAEARRLGHLRLWHLPGGAATWVGGLLLLLGLAWGLMRLIVVVYPQYTVFYDHAFFNVRTYHLAFVALGTALFSAYYAVLLRWLRPAALVGGALLMVALLQAIAQVAVPTSSFLLGFPLLFGAAGWLWALRRTGPAGDPASPAPGSLTWLSALPAVALLAPVLSFVLVVAGLGFLLLVGAVLFAILLGLLLPVLLPTLRWPPAANPWGRWALPAGAGLVAVGALAAGHARSLPTTYFPQQTQVAYMLDAQQAQAYWVSDIPRADAWTRQFFPAPAFDPLPALFPGGRQSVLHQSAPPLALAAPTIQWLADSITPLGHRLRLVVRPGRSAVLSLRVAWPRSVRVVRIAGHTLPQQQGDVLPKERAAAAANAYSMLLFYAPGADGVPLEIETIEPGNLELVVVDRSLGLPSLPSMRALPATMIPAPGYNSFTTQVLKRFQL